MLLFIESIGVRPCRVFDANGVELNYVTFCNTESGEVEQYKLSGDGNPILGKNGFVRIRSDHPAPLQIEKIEQPLGNDDCGNYGVTVELPKISERLALLEKVLLYSKRVVFRHDEGQLSFPKDSNAIEQLRSAISKADPSFPVAKKESRIGGIGNYYGGLSVKIELGKYFWSIEDCGDTSWEEIPESLYTELVMFQLNRVDALA